MGRGRVVMRCDASAAIGAGHLVRCVALAAALRDRGVESSFVMRHPEAATRLLRRFGLAVGAVTTDGGAALPETDARQTIAHAADGEGPVAVLVDHYGADSGWFDAIRTAELPLAVIDDRADRDLTAADLVVNQNFRAPNLDYRVGPETSLLLGTEYALIRPEFRSARAAQARRFQPGDGRVLITFGGGETASECIEALDALDRLDAKLDIRCVIGFNASTDTRVEERAAASRHPVEVIRGVDDMSQHMTWADVSLNAGGSTCWELLCLGVPMVIVALGIDQDGNVRTLPDAGLAIAVDRPAAAGPAVSSLLASPETRESMSRAGATLVDGRGAERTAAALAELMASNAKVGDARA